MPIAVSGLLFLILIYPYYEAIGKIFVNSPMETGVPMVWLKNHGGFTDAIQRENSFACQNSCALNCTLVACVVLSNTVGTVLYCTLL